MKVFLTQSAIADLKSIGDWIAADSPERARAFVLPLPFTQLYTRAIVPKRGARKVRAVFVPLGDSHD